MKFYTIVDANAKDDNRFVKFEDASGGYPWLDNVPKVRSELEVTCSHFNCLLHNGPYKGLNQNWKLVEVKIGDV